MEKIRYGSLSKYQQFTVMRINWQPLRHMFQQAGDRIGMNTALAVLVLLVGTILIWAGYFQIRINLTSSDLQGWLALVLALVGLVTAIYLFNWAMRKSEQHSEHERQIAEWYVQHEREIESERVQEVAFQAYLDRMTELLLDKGLRRSKAGAEVRDIARARTLTVLRGLEGAHKGILVRFLYEADLITERDIIDLSGADLSGAHLKKAILNKAGLTGVDLNGADLSGAHLNMADLYGSALIVADLGGANLHQANLGKANLTEARLVVTNLTEADLTGADLHGANLEGADLIGANLRQADLRDSIMIVANLVEADLSGAILTGANLEAAELMDANLQGADLSRTNMKRTALRGARYNNQTKWPKGLNLAELGAVLIE
jgi:uncharacterized protein YjbI with pentapeptide repeats